MRSLPKPRRAWLRPLRRLLPIPATLAALSLLTACGVRDRVVIQPVAPPPVSEQLTAVLPSPKCTLPPADAYPPERLEFERQCLSAAEQKARNRHSALASAVLVRDAAMAEVIKQQSR